jgi:hypothetical protein
MRKIRCYPLNTKPLEAFAFFVEAIDEKLYDLADDSYKAPALNTYSRTLELQSIVHAHFVAGLKKDALRPFLDELEWSIANDPALSVESRALCRSQIDNIINRATESSQVSRAIAGLRLVLRNYFADIEKILTHIIVNGESRKADILQLAGNFVIQAELNGFPRRHTYHIVQNKLMGLLREEKPPSDVAAALSKFFAEFKKDSRPFACAFLVDKKSVQSRAELLSGFGLKVEAKFPNWGKLTNPQQQFVDAQKSHQVWLIADETTARTAAGAHENVKLAFQAYESTVRFFDHKVSIDLSPQSIARDNESGQKVMTRDAPDAMHGWVGGATHTKEDYMYLAEAVHGGHLADDGASRLLRAMNFHKAALLSNSTENQLIDLWAALEGLLPTPKRDSVRIEYFAESVLPTLTLTYPEKIFASTYRDTLRGIGKATAVLDSVPVEGSRFYKFVSIVLDPSAVKLRDELLKSAGMTPLLRNRLFLLGKSFQDKATIQGTLQSHRKKVKWHLYRIYFMRNSIMHSAMSLPYLPTLVENLHLYVDTIIRTISKVAHASPERLTIEAALEYLSAWEKMRLHPLEHEAKGERIAIDSGNLWSLVFGHGMILTPSKDVDIVGG